MNWFELLTFFNLILSFVLLNLLTRIRPVRVRGYGNVKERDCTLLDRYLEKAENYKKAGKGEMSLLVLRNAFVNYPEKTAVFKLYLERLLEEVNYSEGRKEKIRYLNETERVLLTFSEKVSPEKFILVEDYQERIGKIKERVMKQAS